MTTVMVSEACQHHWVCDAPNGPDSKSRCKKCGEEATFANRLTEEQAQALSFRREDVQSQDVAVVDVKPVITDVPFRRVGDDEDHETEPVEGPEKSKRRSHDHEWDIGDPDENGISIMRCRTCPVEVRADAEGNVYDASGFMLSTGSRIQVRGERGRMVPDKKQPAVRVRRDTREWDARMPEVIKRLDETGSLAQVAREYGLSYAAFEGILLKREVDVSKYKRRGVVAPVAAPGPPALPVVSAPSAPESVTQDRPHGRQRLP